MICLWEASGHSHSRMEAEALSAMLAQAEHMLLGLIQSQLPTETIQYILPLVSKYKQPWMSAAALWSSPSCREHHQVVLCPCWSLVGNCTINLSEVLYSYKMLNFVIKIINLWFCSFHQTWKFIITWFQFAKGMIPVCINIFCHMLPSKITSKEGHLSVEYPCGCPV